MPNGQTPAVPHINVTFQISLLLSVCVIVSVSRAMEAYRNPMGERRLEIVSGKGFNANNQVYNTTSRTSSRSPDLPSQSHVTHPSQVASKPWGFGDAEMRRRKRIAKYKVYTIEGRVKESIKNGLRWFKNKCSEFIHGY